MNLVDGALLAVTRTDERFSVQRTHCWELFYLFDKKIHRRVEYGMDISVPGLVS